MIEELFTYLVEVKKGCRNEYGEVMYYWDFPEKIVSLPPVEDVNFFEAEPPGFSSQLS